MATKELYQEAYYGKLPELEECENLLGKIMERARKEGTKCNPMNYPELKKMESLICKVFGFKTTVIYFIPYDKEINAYTICLYSWMVLGESKDFIKKRSKKGFYDSSHKYFLSIYLYTGLLFEQLGLTAGELFACMLHEIGHNFDYSGYHMIEFAIENVLTKGEFWDEVHNSSSIPHINGFKKEYFDEVDKEAKKLYSNQELRDKTNQETLDELEEFYNPKKMKQVKKLFITALKTGAAVITSPIVQISVLGDKMSEIFADSFATAYGYGLELARGLEKMEKCPIKLKDTTKFTTVMRDLNKCLFEISCSLVDVHGTNQERIKNSIKKLQADLKSSDYPPELKGELKKEIRKLENYYQTLLFASPEEKNVITKRWRRFCDKYFDGAFNFTKRFKQNRV